MNPFAGGTSPNQNDDLTNARASAAQPKEMQAMLLYEDLARVRRREAEQAAREHRLVRRLSAAKRWERLANWSHRKAQRAADQL